MKLEITERQAIALINAIDVFEGSYLHFDELDADTKQDIRSALLVATKVQALLSDKVGA